jgi:hypothetical protein
VASSFLERTPEGKLRLSPHVGQYQAWQSRKRFVLVLAGTQSGKTSWGPSWLHREIMACGPGDYLVVAPTFPLLERKLLPEFRKYFETVLGLGRYTSSPTRVFTASAAGSRKLFGYTAEEPTHVLFGYAEDPESLESATAKAAWLDEADQRRFRVGSYEAILRRLSLAQGRVLLTTTAYRMGWVKRLLYDAWVAAGREHPDIDVIQFDSLANPAFPRAEYDRARRELPPWKFDMFYRGQFARPAGMIYDCFDAGAQVCPPFAIPHFWPTYLGLDFGGVHTAGIFIAADPQSSRLYCYREYLAGGRTAAEHVAHLLQGEPRRPEAAVGGSGAEGQWRAEFGAAGLAVRANTVASVEVGIDRVYGAIKRGELQVFSTLTGLLDQFSRYSRELDEAGEPTETIADKHSFHYLDGLRYVVGFLRPGYDESESLLEALADFVG